MSIFHRKFTGTTGPSVLIITGVHGNEITPILSAIYFMQNNMPKKLKEFYSVMSIVNGANISALHTGTRDIKNDSVTDLNRAFKDPLMDPVSVLKRLINEHDVIIDIHSSPSIPEFVLIDIDEYADNYVKWCKDSEVIYGARYSSANTIKRFALNQGKVAITLELNGMDSPDHESAKNGVSIIEKLLRNYKEEYVTPSEPKVLPMVEVKTYKEGLFTFEVKLGALVNVGDVIGKIVDLEGYLLSCIYSPVKGYIIEGPDTSYYVKAGSKIVLMQPYQEVNEFYDKV